MRVIARKAGERVSISSRTEPIDVSRGQGAGLAGCRTPAADSSRCRENHYLGAIWRPVIKVDDVVVDHSDASGRHVGSDGLRFSRSMDSVARVLAAGEEIHGTRAE